MRMMLFSPTKPQGPTELLKNLQQRGNKMIVPWIAPRDGTDYFTPLPMELRAHIVSLLLQFRQAVQMSVLSRPWRDIHLHTRIVHMWHETGFPTGAAAEDVLAGLESVLLRRVEATPESSKVDILRLSYTYGDDNEPQLRAQVNRIVALADARDIRIKITGRLCWPLEEWMLHLSPSSEHLELDACLALTISGPGAATLTDVCLWNVKLREWPCLPCLRLLSLWRVIIEVPFSPGPAYPLLVDLSIWETSIQQECIDIYFPLLKRLNFLQIDVSPSNSFEVPFGDVTINAAKLEVLNVDLETECTISCEFKSFTLLAPKLRCLNWRNQSAKRMVIEVGRTPSVVEGRIVFKWVLNEDSEKTVCKAQMMRMLRGLLPELSPEGVAAAVRPYMMLYKYDSVDGEAGELAREKLTCDLRTLMSSLQV